MKNLLLLPIAGWLLAATSPVFAETGAAAPQPPPAPPYVWGKAYHILPETHSDESGYFSLCEGANGRIYVGTAKYGVNSFLVEFDPATEKQRIVIDTHQVCGLTASGYAAQAKIHTRNFVGASGTIYVGSKQGYRRGPEDKSDYPGGYVMTYDPATDQAANLGMPYPGQGVIDVTADEKRGLLYVVTCEDQHWLRYDLKTKQSRELGPLLAAYMVTLLDRQGRACALTKDFKLAQYDPATDQVVVRDVLLDGQRLTADDLKTGPICWVVAADGRSAYLVRLSDPTLIRVDLASNGKTVRATSLGKFLGGRSPDCRGSLCLAPDGRVYALVKIINDTGFGAGSLHHLARYDPKSKEMTDLGVLAVKNPDFFDWTPGPDGKPKPWTHGYHKLPDGTLTPLHAHLAMLVARDGSLYATILYPFTLLHIPAIP